MVSLGTATLLVRAPGGQISLVSAYMDDTNSTFSRLYAAELLQRPALSQPWAVQGGRGAFLHLPWKALILPVVLLSQHKVEEGYSCTCHGRLSSFKLCCSANPCSCCRLLRRMLTDLHDLRIVSGQALETWRYKTNDTEAIKDVSSWLDEVKQSEEGAE